MNTGRGLTIMEVLIALVILGLAGVMFFRTTTISQDLGHDARDLQVQARVIENTLDILRSRGSIGQLQSMDSTWTDNTQGIPVNMRVRGAVTPDSLAVGFPANLLAHLRLQAWRPGKSDTLDVNTLIWID